MDSIWIIISFVLGISVGYFRGIVAGYSTKVRDEDKSTVLPIKIIKEQNQYLFYDMNLNQFLHQNKSLQDGMDYILDEYSEKQIVVIKDESV